ncbi:MAG: hypothetical protein OEN56_08510 [Gemmatimonadota bacterium]|nr:hypothetical protein [Gemmatimonadota bacterium]
MRPFYVALTNLVHGLFTALALLVIADVLSPTFNVGGLPMWTGSQATVAIVVVLTTSLALGIVMHTISRGLFHNQKMRWNLEVLASHTMGERLAALGDVESFPGAPTYAALTEGETSSRLVNAAAFMHGIEYQVMLRAHHVFDTIQMYRDQYRMARAFVVPSVIFAIALPFWDPVVALDGAGAIGPFPIIRSQAFLLSVLAATVSFVAFRERAYRYAAAKALAWITLERFDFDPHEDDH